MAEQKQGSLPVTLLLPVLGWVAGMFLATALQVPLLWLAIISAGCIAFSIIIRFRFPAVPVLFLLAGFLRLSVAIQENPSPLHSVLKSKSSITQACSGKVIRVLSDRAFVVRIKAIGNTSADDLAMLYGNFPMKPGDSFGALAKISLRQADPVLDKTSFYQTHRYRRTRLAIKPVYRLELTKNSNLPNLERIRYDLLQSLDRRLGTSAPFAKALLLNDRTDDRDWLEQLIQGGLLHLIAISGLHVLFFFLVFVTLFNIFLPRKTSELIFVVLMLAYAGLCQWSAPVMRAIIMIMLYLIARWLQRPVATLQIICLSLFIITVIDPVQMFSVGLQLSYLCIIVIIYAIPRWRLDLTRKSLWERRLALAGKYIIDTVVISSAVSFVLLPLSLYYFQRGGLNSIIGNLLGIPLMAVLLPLTFAIMVMPSGWFMFSWLRNSFELLHNLFRHWVDWTAQLPFYMDRVPISLTLLIVFYLIIAALLIRIKSGARLRKLTYAMLLIAVPVAVLSVLPRAKPFTLTVFNAGQGDCILMQSPQGQTVMVDTGPGFYCKDTNSMQSWFGRRTQVWQNYHRINRIDLLVLTHLDSDHSGGVIDVFRQMKVRNLLISNYSASSKEWRELERTGLLSEARIIVIDDTLSFYLGGAKISVLHPSDQYTSINDNDNSLVLRIDYKGFSALLTGDVSSSAELHLLSENPAKLDVDFLKAPHHGSRYSNAAPFIRAVSPSKVCITAGRDNKYRFPHEETLQRYRDYGIEPQITYDGSVVVTVK